MEEDIKILLKNLKTEKEKWIDKIYGVGETRIDLMIDDVIKAIENLIKGYRDLEEQIDKHVYFETTNPKEIEKNYIPKSKIKEKIEELEKEKEETYTKFLAGNRKDEFLSTKGKMLEGATQVLQELMEDK